MKNKGFLHKFSDLVLDHPVTNDWLKNPPLRSSWYGLLVYIFSFLFISTIFRSTPLLDYLSEMEYGVLGYRVFMTILATLGLVLFFQLTFHYFRHTIGQGNSIRFGNVLTFYLGEISFFALLYYFLFYVNPEFFKYNETLVKWSPLIRQLPISSTKFYFMLYTAFESVGGKSVFIESNSIPVSIINYIQTLYSFCLVSLLIAGYINQKTNKPA